MLIKKYYYNCKDINRIALGPAYLVPYESKTLKYICDELGIAPTTLPFALNDLYVEGLWQRIISRYYDDYLFVIKKDANEEEPDNSEVDEQFVRWIERFFSFLVQTYNYYYLILKAYTDAQGTLMNNIKATSKNKVNFNDTPQNANTGDTYEGDNYITHFTKTEGETSSPLMTPIMRLKEIQDHVKRTWADWVDEAERLFIEGENL